MSKSRCRRIYAEVDEDLPPRQETTVPVRVSHRNRRDLPFVGVTESFKILNLSKVYSKPSAFPARCSDIQICVANTSHRLQGLKKGSHLGNIESADIVGPASLEPQRPSRLSRIWTDAVQLTKEAKEMPTEQVIEDIMKSLLMELTNNQRLQVHRLNDRNKPSFGSLNTISNEHY